MANPNPTNINVPPALAADPTNINATVHGTKSPGGVVNSDGIFTLAQRSDLGNGVTGVIVDSFTAPFRIFLRQCSQFNYSLAATMSCVVKNTTQTIDIITSFTPVTNTESTPSFASAAGQLVEAGDVIQVQATTSGGGGAVKGLRFTFFYTQLAGSATNPV